MIDESRPTQLALSATNMAVSYPHECGFVFVLGCHAMAVL